MQYIRPDSMFCLPLSFANYPGLLWSSRQHYDQSSHLQFTYELGWSRSVSGDAYDVFYDTWMFVLRSSTAMTRIAHRLYGSMAACQKLGMALELLRTSPPGISHYDLTTLFVRLFLSHTYHFHKSSSWTVIHGRPVLKFSYRHISSNPHVHGRPGGTHRKSTV